MTEKALSISVAAYNVEDTLARCLDSCVDERILDELEVIVVIDGATDGSAAIARTYEERWPGTFRVVEKENGGYGSTVNTSMRLATGRYFRLLDGDDWLDREGLYELVTFCREGHADAVWCDRVEERPEGPITHEHASGFPVKREIRDSRLLGLLSPGMWFMTFNSCIMKEHPFELPEHCLYTDTLFATFHLPWVESVVRLEKPLYHYFVGQNDGQSTSLRSVLTHVDDYYNVWNRALDFILHNCGEDHLTPLVLKRLLSSYNNVYQRTLMLPPARENKGRLAGLEADLAKRSPRVHRYVGSNIRAIKFMRATRGLAYLPLCAYRHMRPYGM